jgi:hypothetical protein
MDRLSDHRRFPPDCGRGRILLFAQIGGEREDLFSGCGEQVVDACRFRGLDQLLYQRHGLESGDPDGSWNEVLLCHPGLVDAERGLSDGVLGHLDQAVRVPGADIRKFSAFSHVLALLYGHLSGASSLNEICDAFRLLESKVNRSRGAGTPKRTTFSNANRTRDPDIAKKLYWAVFAHLQSICPSFACMDDAAHQDSKYMGVVNIYLKTALTMYTQ